MAENLTPQAAAEPMVRQAGDAAPQQPEGISAGHRGGGLRLLFWLIVFLCATGTFLGMMSLALLVRATGSPPVDAARRAAYQPAQSQLAQSQASQSPPAAEAAGTESIKMAPAVPLSPVAALDEADRLLAADDIGAAARIYHQLAETSDSAADPLRYRLALCAEALGQVDQAQAHYRALAGHAGSPLAVPVRLAQARIWFNTDQLDLARSVLCQLALENPQRETDETLQADITHLLAHVLAREALGKADTNLIDDRSVVRPHLSWSPAHALAYAQLVQINAVAAERLDDVVQVVHRFGTQPEDIQLRIQLKTMPVAAMLDLVFEASELSATWSDSAREDVYGRTVGIALGNRNMAMLLDLVLEPLGLTWSAEEHLVSIFAKREAERDVVVAAQRIAAQRALRNAVSTFPDHELTAAAYLTLGNLSMAAGRAEDAAALYGQLLRQFARTSLKGETWFNQAKAALLLGRLGEAREAFFRVVDVARGRPLEGAAYLYAGRLALEEGEVRAAVAALVRAVSLAANTPYHATAAVTLATAFVMADNPIRANAVLMDNRIAIESSPQKELGALLSALARYQAARTPAEVQRAGRSLISSLAHVRAEDFFGGQGYYLLGQTYQQLGLSENAATVYRQGLEKGMQGPLRAHILLSLAEHELAYHDADEAKNIYRQLAAGDLQPWAGQAKRKLAEIAFADGQLDECLAMCGALLSDENPAEEIAAVLRLMGRVYERRQDHYNAALCFSGLVPDVAQTPPGNRTPPGNTTPPGETTSPGKTGP